MSSESVGVELGGRSATPRVKPSMGVAVAIIVMYTAVFFAVWIVNDVDYATIGLTAESTRLHYAMPTLLASAAVALVITYLGWWKLTLFDSERSGPAWAWLGAIVMFGLAVATLFLLDSGELNRNLVLYSILGAIGVGFGEEMVYRGGLLVALRSRFTEEKVWFFSTLVFAAVHMGNVFFGMPIEGALLQLPLAFIVGSLLYSVRRLGGTLIVCMFLHGLWDSASFLSGAAGEHAYYSFLIYPIAIICAVAVIKQNRGKRLPV